MKIDYLNPIFSKLETVDFQMS